VSKRREIDRHLRSLGEIKEIMGAMKNVALTQTRKLSRLLATQDRVVANIEAAADDFLTFNPQFSAAPEIRNDVYLLIGSERGFCGDFNDAFSNALSSRMPARADTALLIVGSKLSLKFAHDMRVTATLKGPNTLEEVPAVLRQLMQRLVAWQQTKKSSHSLRLNVFHHRPESGEIHSAILDPFLRRCALERHYSYAPLLNLQPRQFLEQLTEHYLFAALHRILYRSLMAENQLRMQHMDRAVHRIEQQSALLQRRRNSLRQEEITEEIEVIMLNTDI